MQKARALIFSLIFVLMAPLPAHAQQWAGRFSEPIHTTATQFAATELTPETLYRFRLRAEDASENLSDYSAIVEEITLTAIRRAEREGGTVSGGFFQ